MQIKEQYKNITSDSKGYFLGENKYPRVSTFLGNLDKRFLIAWASKMCANKVGEFLDSKIVLPEMKCIFDAHLKDEMLELAKKEHIRVMNEAGEYGTLVHNAIETWLKGGDLNNIAKTKEEKELIKEPLESFKKWWIDGEYELVASELAVVSKEYKFGGRIDIVARKKHELIVVDIKTGSGVYKSAKAQCGGYSIALDEMCENLHKFDFKYKDKPSKENPHIEKNIEVLKISKTIICHIPKKNPKLKAIVVEGEEFEQAKNVFINLVDLYYNLKGVK